ncbi:MAG: 16S rRNA (guanine(527)-N(7))-methyltransferase RsmG [Chthonomonadales bacterium]
MEFIQAVAELGISLSDNKVRLLNEYADLLEEKNQVLNLTRISREDFDTLQALDSLAIVKAIPTIAEAKVIDVGTGAGIPGVILKIVFPQWDITLLDSTRKKLTFLDEVIAKLRLKSIRTLHGRAEEIGRDPEYRQRFDIVTARAVTAMPSLSEWCLPLLKTGGKLVALKGETVEDELAKSEKGIQVLGGGRPKLISYDLPGTEIHRKIVLVEKIRTTPVAYPRASTIIKNAPL